MRSSIISYLAKEIARRYDIYDLVAELLETENSWFDSPKHKPKAKVRKADIEQDA